MYKIFCINVLLFVNMFMFKFLETDTLSTTNLGLRLVASTVTSFLILALLLFMIHRLRQRRLLLMIRRKYLKFYYKKFCIKS